MKYSSVGSKVSAQSFLLNLMVKDTFESPRHTSVQTSAKVHAIERKSVFTAHTVLYELCFYLVKLFFLSRRRKNVNLVTTNHMTVSASKL